MKFVYWKVKWTVQRYIVKVSPTRNCSSSNHRQVEPIARLANRQETEVERKAKTASQDTSRSSKHFRSIRGSSTETRRSCSPSYGERRCCNPGLAMAQCHAQCLHLIRRMAFRRNPKNWLSGSWTNRWTKSSDHWNLQWNGRWNNYENCAHLLRCVWRRASGGQFWRTAILRQFYPGCGQYGGDFETNTEIEGDWEGLVICVVNKLKWMTYHNWSFGNIQLLGKGSASFTIRVRTPRVFGKQNAQLLGRVVVSGTLGLLRCGNLVHF